MFKPIHMNVALWTRPGHSYWFIALSSVNVLGGFVRHHWKVNYDPYIS